MEAMSNNRNILSGDPADPQRSSITGSKSVQWATEDFSIVSHQATESVHATEDNKKPSIRHKHKIGTWNVRGILKPGKLEVIEKEMREYQLLIMGLCETHKKGRGHFKTPAGNTVFFSGHETESKNGVGVIMSRKLVPHITGYNTINDRIMTIRIDSTPIPLNIIQVYSPTAQSSQEDIDEFYGMLQTTIESISKREMTIIQGDWNAKVGSTEQDDHIRHIIGKYGLGTRNERGEKLIDFCVSQELAIMNTFFKHHKRKLYTWISPGDRFRNQIDYITIGKRWKSSVTNTRTFPGADCGSDHQLLVADIRLRLKSCHKNSKPTRRLAQLEYEYFQNKTEPELTPTEITNTSSEAQWESFKSKIVKGLESMNIKSQPRKDWISDETWINIGKRKELKKGVRSVDNLDEYSTLYKLIQRQCRRDKNYYLENICTEIEHHADKYQTGDLFRKIKQIIRHWPKDWVHSSILPLHKKGSVRNCSNYRTIALVSHASKILLHVINSRLKSFLDWQIPQEQAGFVRGRGTREQILNLRLIVEKCYEYNTPVFMCFVDYQNAFDCVKWEKLWETLSETGVPSHLVMLIRNLYESGVGSVSVENATSSKFRFQKGVRQGCVISPILFNIYGEYIMRQTLENWEGGVRIGGVQITNLRYADDTTLLASSEAEMKELLVRLEAISLNMGLAINKSKTKLLVVDRFSSIQRTDLLAEYEAVDQFVYLGSVITDKGSCEPEIRRRIGMAKTAMTQLSKVWKDHWHLTSNAPQTLNKAQRIP
ncbi:uncharacterized protein LOC114245976 [Bombyx mandarina]|uniref:Uncharacterized protein LOC114245976 n=1 Tax=Bombyx mandarina TaxID=7092 RepID=A0A6J2JWB3_BOMMA|nr:uncharacterized protein LOC114245976 [Bombyx mandarina]